MWNNFISKIYESYGGIILLVKYVKMQRNISSKISENYRDMINMEEWFPKTEYVKNIKG